MNTSSRPAAPRTGQPAQYLAFTLGDAEYAVELLRVREILEFVAPTRVPGTPPFVRGVINLRGTVVPIVDLHVKLRLREVPESRWACIAVLEVEGGWGEIVQLGVIADAVTDIVELGAGDIESPPPFGTQIRLDFLRGVGKKNGQLYLVLELDRVLSPEELSAAQEVAGGEAATPGETT